jgi:hypothetical protein
MKATIKNIISAAVIGTSFFALPLSANAAQSEHQRYLIQKAMQAKQEAKREQAKQEHAKNKDEKVCDDASKASHAEDTHATN